MAGFFFANFECIMYNLNSDKDQYYILGKVIKTHGYKGELVFLLETDNPDAYSDLDMVFVNMDSSLVPWFIENIRINDDLAVVKLEDISDPDQARVFLKKELYLPVDKLSQLAGTNFYFHEIVGYQVMDKTYGEIGIVDEILDRPEQELIRILKGEKEILVPMTDEMIVDIDRKNKILLLDTPPGLIDLYLE